MAVIDGLDNLSENTPRIPFLEFTVSHNEVHDLQSMSRIKTDV
jgi:hypothetical protein